MSRVVSAALVLNLFCGAAVGPNPTWLTSARTRKIQDRVERILEWDVRQVRFYWYSSELEFARSHGLGRGNAQLAAPVLAVTRASDQSIHFGPRVTSENYDAVFAHELTHVILFQKYKTAIPAWLEEGLANWVSRSKPADRNFLRTQGYRSVRTLAHPFAGSVSQDQIRYHYQLSQAAIEFIDKRCDLRDLLQLAVGKKLETYLRTTCGIADLDGELKAWIELAARR